jgi:mediator of RNA polymerase II transcription subunit 12, fungi type
MSSRTPIGGQPRPPQRTLSASSLSVGRPSQQQRTLSQQFLPSSPVRKDGSSSNPSSFVDLTADGAHDAAVNPNTPRLIKGSRLRQELSVDTIHSMGWMPEISSPLTASASSRPVPFSDAIDAGQHSPAMSRSSFIDPDNPPMPMPERRPRTQQPLHRTQRQDPTPTILKKDSRPRPYVVETPSAAPRCPPPSKQDKPLRDLFSKGLYSGFADFHPWTGKHHEDEWNSEGIQKGIWDRCNQSETGSARLAIYPPIRQQKQGLNALSQLFMTVLNQRRTKGLVTAPSTFKPPPRVTLTDTKREVWMKDLANPAIALRRLSRTIPHGIRGRTLLDQCLNKGVPIERAVWLVKCVGSNEIRAFKRKGVNAAFLMGLELKWARDWTVHVEQFVEAVVSAFEEVDWRSRVTYAYVNQCC